MTNELKPCRKHKEFDQWCSHWYALNRRPVSTTVSSVQVERVVSRNDLRAELDTIVSNLLEHHSEDLEKIIRGSHWGRISFEEDDLHLSVVDKSEIFTG